MLNGTGKIRRLVLVHIIIFDVINFKKLKCVEFLFKIHLIINKINNRLKKYHFSYMPPLHPLMVKKPLLLEGLCQGVTLYDLKQTHKPLFCFFGMLIGCRYFYNFPHRASWWVTLRPIPY